MSSEYLVVLILSAALAPSAAHACESVGPATAIDAVRAQRDAFNAAIANKNLEAVTATIRGGVVLVTGTTNEVISGRAAQVSLWHRSLATPGRAVFVRTTDCIRVSEVVPVALETDRWRGVREDQAEKPGAENFAAGTYAAKWRRIDHTWLLEAEIFSTEACGGDLCPVDDGDR